MGEFLQKDRIPEFNSITEIDCLPDFTFAKQDGIIIMYHLVIDQKTTSWLEVDTLIQLRDGNSVSVRVYV